MDTKVGSEIHGPKPVGTEPEPKKLRNIDQIGSEPEQFSNLGPNCPRTMRIPGSDIEFLVKSEIDLILKKSKPAKFAKI